MQMTYGGGPIIRSPTVITITFADFPFRAEVESFGTYLVTSPWLAQVGQEYHIGFGSNINIELETSAPSQLTDSQLQQMLIEWINTNTVPSQQAKDASAAPSFIYMVYLPHETAVTLNGETLCPSSEGYHGFLSQGIAAVYSVILLCRSQGATEELSSIESAASHEFIESATDPFFDAFSSPSRIAGYVPPIGPGAAEVADLCSGMPIVQYDSYTMVPIWSDWAALHAMPPCQPSASETFFSVSSEPCPQYLSPGESHIFTITGWSTAATSAWEVTTRPLDVTPYPSFTPALDWNNVALNNGQSATMTITVPEGTASGSATSFRIYSGDISQSIPFAIGVIVR
jgi:hypothetical protein